MNVFLFPVNRLQEGIFDDRNRATTERECLHEWFRKDRLLEQMVLVNLFSRHHNVRNYPAGRKSKGF